MSLNHLISTVLYIATLSVGIFIALGVLELEKTVTSLLAGIGILGLALGFAFQDTAANFVSGILLTIRTPIKNGDIIEINDIMGVVQKINLRATEIVTFQGTFVIIPNKIVFQNPLFNYSHTGRRRVDLEGRVSYQDDLEKVKEIVLKSVAELDSISKERETLFNYHEFGETGIKFTVRAWVTDLLQARYLESQHQIIVAIKKAFDENDITIPLAIRTLNFGAKDREKLDEILGKGRND